MSKVSQIMAPTEAEGDTIFDLCLSVCLALYWFLLSWSSIRDSRDLRESLRDDFSGELRWDVYSVYVYCVSSHHVVRLVIFLLYSLDLQRVPGTFVTWWGHTPLLRVSLIECLSSDHGWAQVSQWHCITTITRVTNGTNYCQVWGQSVQHLPGTQLKLPFSRNW